MKLSSILSSTRSLVAWLPLVGVVGLLASPASAAEPVEAVPAVQGEALGVDLPGDEAGGPPPDGAPAFVDRDGDGLQDGQEHRFRGRWRQPRGQGGLGEGTLRRHRAGQSGEGGPTGGPGNGGDTGRGQGGR